MKTNKLIAAGALALSMAMTPVASILNAMPLMAETVTNNTDHSYIAYQIFSGTQATDDTQGILGQIAWSTNVDIDKVKELIKGTAFETTKGDAAEIAKLLAGTNGNALAPVFAKIVEQSLTQEAAGTTIAANDDNVDLTAGYYLLIDNTSKEDENFYRNLSLLQVTKKGDIEITKKNDIPTVDKKVQDEKTENGNPLNDKTETDFYYNADHSIGEEFKFQLTGTVPANTMNLYDTYFFQFNDTLSKGVDFVMDNDKPKGLTIFVNDQDKTSSFNVSVSEDGKGLTVKTDNLKNLVSNASSKAVVVVTYTAKLNGNAVITEVTGNKLLNNNKVNLEYSNNPNYNGSGDKGKTPDEYVYVGTYKLPNSKVDGAGDTLAGAKFKLQNKEGQFALITDRKITGWNGTGTEIVSDEYGDFSISGLDAGTYTLIETEAPAGFNKAANVEVVISADHKPSTTDKTDNDKVELKLTADKEETDTVTVINNKGGSLPETGGMGTTMIYGAGALMVAGAAVVFVTNKRTRKN